MSAVLLLPNLNEELLSSTWRYGRKQDDPKINAAVYSIKCIFAAMCGMHVHSQNGMKKADIWIVCETKYNELVRALRHKYPDCVAARFIGHTSNKLNKKITGDTIYRLSQHVRKTCVNSFNVHWKGSLDGDVPPSGREWDWVRMRVLVILYREYTKNTQRLPENQGYIIS